jgi:hypothetical protein
VLVELELELEPDDDERFGAATAEAGVVTVHAEMGHSFAGDLSNDEVHPTPAAESTGGESGAKKPAGAAPSKAARRPECELASSGLSGRLRCC